MQRFLRLAGLLLTAGAYGFAQTPVVSDIDLYGALRDETSVEGAAAPSVPSGGVLNNASYVLDGLPGDGIARGSLFAVFGAELGPATPVTATEIPLQTELGGTSIEVTVNGITRQAFLLVSSAGQLAAVLPSDLPAGNGELVVSVAGARSAGVAIRVVHHAFGAFTRNQAGFGPAIVQNFVSATEQPLNAVTNAAHPGQVGILWGSGLGPIDGSDAELPPVGNIPVNVEVWVGGRRANVLYAGRAPQFPAIDQINFVIPDGVLGCYVPVVVVVDGVVSNHTTIAVVEEGPNCVDPLIFRDGDLDRAVADGQGSFGFVELARFRGTLGFGQQTVDVAVDQVLASFDQYTLPQLASATPLRETIAPVGSCISTREPARGRSDPVSKRSLDAGEMLVLAGPKGEKSIPFSGSDYEAQVGGGFGNDEVLPEFFVPGEYVLRGGAANADIQPFETRFTLPEAPQWINQSQFSVISRDQDLTVQWAGADRSTEVIFVAIQSINENDQVSGSLFCVADAAANSFTILSRDLGTLPPNTPWDGDGDPTGLMSLGTESTVAVGRIDAPGLTGGMVFYALRQVRSVTIQ